MMRCPRCQHTNGAQAKFCEECASPLVTICPRCGSILSSTAKFCSECAAPVASEAPAPHPAAPHPEPVRSSPDAPTASAKPGPERRQLTVMFCDLVGSTALSQQLDAEDLRELMRAYQEAAGHVIERYEGHVAQYLGDGLMVYFGWPQAHEDDAARAVRAGLDVVKVVHALPAPERLRVRVGIATGPVVVGETGAGDASIPKMAVGETPNLAARVQGLAGPDEVVIAPTTHRLVSDAIDALDRGEHMLKGIVEPVRVWQVLGLSPAGSRFEAASLMRGLTPLVGREEEIGLLRSRWVQTHEGDGQVVLLSGEAGIGKSRLLDVLKREVAPDPQGRWECRCSPYHGHSALYPFIDLFRRALALEPDEPPEAKLRKLETAQAQYGFFLADTVPIWASLLSISLPDRYAPLSLSPQRLRRRTLEVIVALLLAVAERRPMLVLVEDLHWSDPSTMELLDLILEQVPTTRILALFTFRPEFRPPWAPRSHMTALTLNRFTQAQASRMVQRVAGDKPLPIEVVAQVVSRTDGVPLFVEELTKMVLEAGLVDAREGRYELAGPIPALAIPTTLQDSLMARLDRLETAKEVAQLGAVLGRAFPYGLLRAVAQLDETALQDALARLVDAELLYRRGLPPRATFIFRHALIQEAAYQSLLKSTRQHSHLRVAQVLAAQFPDVAETQPELLAHHYTEAGLEEQAIPYWHQAGQRASERSANVEAIAHLTTGLTLVKHLPETRQHAMQELDLQLAVGPALMATKSYGAPEVAQAYLRARELGQEVGEAPQLFTATWGLWLHHQHRAQLTRARALADEVLALAEQQADTAVRLQAHHAGWTTLFSVPDLRSVRGHTEQGIALYNLHDHRTHAFTYGGHDPGVCARSHSALTLWFLGYPDQALERADDAVTLAEQLSHPFSLVLALTFSAFVHQYRHEVDVVQERAAAAIALCNEHGIAPQYVALGDVLRSWACVAEGRAEEGIALARQGLGALRATGVGLRGSFCLALLAQAYAHIGQADEGLEVLGEALDSVEKTGERTWEAEIYRVKGKLLASSAHTQLEGESCLDRAIEIAGKQSAVALQLRAATSLSSLWRAQGKLQEAHALLAPIYGRFVEGFDTADLKAAKAVLDSLP